MRIAAAVTLVALVAHARAQVWSITANAPVAGSAQASVLSGINSNSQSATLPVGPVTPGTFLACSASLAAYSELQMAWDPSVIGQSAPLAFTASSHGYSQASSNSATFAVGNAQIDLTLTAPQPVGGRLWVRAVGQGGTPPFASIHLDLDANGTVDFTAHSGADPQPVDLPLQIPATGAVIRLDYSSFTQASSGQSSWSMLADVTLEALFLPDEPAVTPFATTNTGIELLIDHGLTGTVTLSIDGPGATPVLMAFGGMPINVPLLPYVTVLVSPVLLMLSTGSITLPLPPFPPGTALYAQGLALDWLGNPRSTNSVQALWP